MILIPEQIVYLREQRRNTKHALAGYSDYLSSKDITSGDYYAKEVIGDGVTDNQYHQERRKLGEITDLLENSEYLKKRQTDEIAIGTKFRIKFDGTGIENEFLLVESINELPIGQQFISIESPLGKSVAGKKEGERFSYVLNGRDRFDRQVITGTVTAIEKDLNNYTNFIRRKEKSDRICREAQARRKAYLAATTVEELEQYKELFAITPSQKQLLRIETERLLKQPRTNQVAQRLGVIKTILESAPVITQSPADGKVSLGEKVTLVISRDGKELETREYEVINEAVSDEIETEYLERISPLGNKVFGAKVGDVITFRENKKNYKAVITKIDEQKTNAEDIKLTSTHQYRK